MDRRIYHATNLTRIVSSFKSNELLSFTNRHKPEEQMPS
jgi:hypothetical protein